MATAAEAELADVLQRTEALQARVETESQLAATMLPPLPSDVVELIFLLVPLDSRLRCREVARGWRALLERRRLWLDCDLSAVPSALRFPALLRAASARAGGQLRTLNVSGWGIYSAEVLDVVRENSASLLELRAAGVTGFGKHDIPERAELEELLSAAPQLRLLECDLWGSPTDVSLLLSRVPSIPLWLECLSIDCTFEALTLPVFEQIAAHSTLNSLVVCYAVFDAASANALTDTAVALRLSKLFLSDCSLPAGVLPAIMRLLSTGSLAELSFDSRPLGFVADQTSLPAFCESLRASSLSKLTLSGCDLFITPLSSLAILATFTAHSSLKELDLSCNELDSDEARTAAGIHLGQILSATPALKWLNVSRCSLYDAGVRPLFAAVARSTTLRELYCFNAGVSAECARDCILPAVQANTSLRRLALNSRIPELRQAEALVNARAGAA